jgi:hypothetical protein
LEVVMRTPEYMRKSFSSVVAKVFWYDPIFETSLRRRPVSSCVKPGFQFIPARQELQREAGIR